MALLNKNTRRAFGVAAMSAGLSGCFGLGSDLDLPKGDEALQNAITAEVPNGNLAAVPTNKSYTTNWDGARQLVIGKKVGNVEGQPRCAYFDVLYTRPSGLDFWGQGLAAVKTGVLICLDQK